MRERTRDREYSFDTQYCIIKDLAYVYPRLHIKDYKSVDDLSLKLGRINVFIGENGCGKSDIWEAVAMLSCSSNDKLKNDDLANKTFKRKEEAQLK